MADILLAECGDGVWLVGGEAHLDDLLANTLPPDVGIGLVACERPADVRALWERHGGDAAGGMPWLVHPAIVARVKRTLQDAAPKTVTPRTVTPGTVTPGTVTPETVVRFSPWSALLDEAALAAIAMAAARMTNEVIGGVTNGITGGAGITLVEYLDPAGPPAIAALSGLRLQLIEDQLAGHGVPRDRIGRDRRDVGEMPGLGQESQRVDILVG
jgi:hypothetical protein